MAAGSGSHSLWRPPDSSRFMIEASLVALWHH